MENHLGYPFGILSMTTIPKEVKVKPSSEILGLKPRRFTAALLLNLSAFTKYVLECEVWKKPIRFDFTPHPNKSRYCGALWAV